jgi:hypothetical protein
MPDGTPTFNSPLETGVRALIILAEAYPQGLDLQRILEYDYMMVHTGDFENGPPSIHPALPLRSGELLVRRELIDRGLMLMINRALVTREATHLGFVFRAHDDAGPFLDSLTAEYISDLRNRAAWVVERFATTSDQDVRVLLSQVYDQWSREFQIPEQPGLF